MQPQQFYPPQFPQQAPPQAPAYPQQFAPQFPQQGYPQQFAPQFQAPAAPSQPLAQGTIDDFYNQPTAGGGKALKFERPGQTRLGVVSRPIGNGDIQQQTDIQSKPLFFRDGRPKFVMRVPLQMQPSPEYPDGIGTWYVKGADRDELNRAMAEAGAPEGAPEYLAVIQITYTQDQQSGAGMNPRKVKQVLYRRPDGAAPVAPPAAPQQPAQPDPVLAAAQAQIAALQATQQAPAAPTFVPPQVQQLPPGQAFVTTGGVQTAVAGQPLPPAQGEVQQVAPAAQAVQVPAQPAPAAPSPVAGAAPQPPAGLSQAQQELLAKLGG